MKHRSPTNKLPVMPVWPVSLGNSVTRHRSKNRKRHTKAKFTLLVLAIVTAATAAAIIIPR